MKITSEIEHLKVLDRIEEIKKNPLFLELEELYNALECYDLNKQSIILSADQCDKVLGWRM